MCELRKRIAKLAKGIYTKEVTYKEFMQEVPEEGQDELIDELVDLIEHEPQKGGIFGIKEKDHATYLKEIFEVINKLENSS